MKGSVDTGQNVPAQGQLCWIAGYEREGCLVLTCTTREKDTMTAALSGLRSTPQALMANNQSEDFSGELTKKVQAS